MQAGLQLKNALYSKDQAVRTQHQQRWLQFPEDVRMFVKQNVSMFICASDVNITVSPPHKKRNKLYLN